MWSEDLIHWQAYDETHTWRCREFVRGEDGEITAGVIFNLFKGQMDTKRASYGWISKT
jgi:hypothetical protein